jgi:hypothetical protein
MAASTVLKQRAFGGGPGAHTHVKARQPKKKREWGRYVKQ